MHFIIHYKARFVITLISLGSQNERYNRLQCNWLLRPL